MKCRIFGHLKKTTLLLLAALLSFLPLFSGVLLQDVNAYDLDEPLGAFGINRIVSIYGKGPTEILNDSSFAYYGSDSYGVMEKPSFYFNSSRAFTKGQVLSFTLYLEELDLDHNPPLCPSTVTPDTGFRIIGCDYQFNVNIDYFVNQIGTMNGSSNYFTSVGYSDRRFTIINLDLLVSKDITVDHFTVDGKLFYFGSQSKDATIVYFSRINLYTGSTSLVDIYNFLQNNVSSESIESAVDNSMENQEQKVQDQTDAAQTSADSQGQQAESSGTTLLAAFTSFVGAVTSASPTSCVISGDLGIGGFSTGDLDLCAFSPPPVLQVVSSLIMIGALVPISIFTARKMINLFRSFTNG